MNTNIAYLKNNNIKYFKLLNILIIIPHESIHYEHLLYNRHKGKRIYPKTIEVQIHNISGYYKTPLKYCPYILINIY